MCQHMTVQLDSKLVALDYQCAPRLTPFLRQYSVLWVFKSNSYTEQSKVETDVDRMTGIELATLQLRRPRTNRLSYICF